MLHFKVKVPRSMNYSARDLIHAATQNLTSWRVYGPHGELFIRGADGHLYRYDHWDIKHIDERTDEITVYMKPIDERS